MADTMLTFGNDEPKTRENIAAKISVLFAKEEKLRKELEATSREIRELLDYTYDKLENPLKNFIGKVVKITFMPGFGQSHCAAERKGILNFVNKHDKFFVLSKNRLAPLDVNGKPLSSRAHWFYASDIVSVSEIN